MGSDSEKSGQTHSDIDEERDDEKKEQEGSFSSGKTLCPPPLPPSLLNGVLKEQTKEKEVRGLLMPSECNLFFAPIDLSEHIREKIDYFANVYGCDMGPLREDAIELYLTHATYDIEIDGTHLLHAKGMRLKQYAMY